jgi:hypothetical protein
MNNKAVIEFILYNDDDPLEVQLEPEPIIFKVAPGNQLKFIATNCTSEFQWSLRIAYSDNAIQLFPDSMGKYDIEIYENGILLNNHYKYM